MLQTSSSNWQNPARLFAPFSAFCAAALCLLQVEDIQRSKIRFSTIGHYDSSPVLLSFAFGGNNAMVCDVRLAAHVTQSRHGKVTHHCSMAWQIWVFCSSVLLPQLPSMALTLSSKRLRLRDVERWTICIAQRMGRLSISGNKMCKKNETTEPGFAPMFLLAFVFQGSVLRAGSQALCECDPVCRVAWRDKNHQKSTGQAKQLSAWRCVWGKTWQSCWSLFLVVSWLIIWGSSAPQWGEFHQWLQALLWCKRFSQIFSWKLLWWTKACERLPCGDYWLPSCKWTIKKGICVLQA